jgi:glycosyltransferase involved in cell wall biosynthesis
MTAEPTVSVMVPTYNQEKYLLRAIESILKQTYGQIEVIVSDDCSTDRTEDLVRDYMRSSHDTRIKYFRNDRNLGILRNYHQTLSRAQGDYVINLDGDDFFVNNEFLKTSVDRLEADQSLGLVFADYCEFQESTGTKINIRNHACPPRLTDKEFFSRFAKDKILWNHNTILYRRKLALEIGFYWHPETPRNDWESFLRIIVGKHVGYVPFVAAAWVQHGRNETQRPDLTKYLQNFVLVKGVADYAAPILGVDFSDHWYKEMLWSKTRSSSIGYLKNRDFLGWLVFLSKAWQVRPWLTLRALFDLGLWARYLLALSPGIYAQAKLLVRTFKNPLK